MQTHWPCWQVDFAPEQVTHAWPSVPQTAVLLPGWQVPLPSQQPVGQVAGEQVGVPWQRPVAEQVWPGKQLPHFPVLPQPSSPHSRLAQLGAQHNPAWPPVMLH